ncbi:probable periplasmic serine endoprotease DegP-like [Ylistrum balloti]|uniref:probable periplasmic serine endoprotease DegP-like n=1 Tax=Ylistrum balloti TaxID=509963 RepID=UPI002905825A|nr:probable periplasmic serine endoprotease DegP-like [Ylistrum balloti]
MCIATVAFPQSDFLFDLQEDTRKIAQDVLPTVVQIDVSSTIEVGQRRSFFFFFNNPFRERENGDTEPPKREFNQQGLGSGVILRKNRQDTYYVITNEHVINNADTIAITTYEDNTYDGKVVGVDAGRDLAVLSFVSEYDYKTAEIGDSDELEPGDIVFAVGNPYGFQSSITFGIISALNRASRGAGVLTDYIQTDAAVNRGNSGGPLINIQGEVIGINTWIYSEGGGGNEGLSFAVPINNAMISVNSVIEKGRVDYGWLGVYVETANNKQVPSLGQQKGALVLGVYSDSPADKAGVKPGDIIYSVEKAEVTTHSELITAITAHAPNYTVVIDLYRSSIPLSLSIRLGDREKEQNDTSLPWPGFKIADISKSIRKKVQTSDGVIITNVIRESAAYTSGLRVGDVIEKINNTKIRNAKEFYSVLNLVDKEKEALFRLRRDDTMFTIGIVNK